MLKSFIAILSGALIGVALTWILFWISDPIPADADDTDIKSFICQGQILRAVRWYRAIHRVGVKEAHEGVSRLAQEITQRER